MTHVGCQRWSCLLCGKRGVGDSDVFFQHLNDCNAYMDKEGLRMELERYKSQLHTPEEVLKKLQQEPGKVEYTPPLSDDMVALRKKVDRLEEENKTLRAKLNQAYQAAELAKAALNMGRP